jgi:hypothetical protein
MSFGEADSIWLKKGATLSDKSAREEFGLTQNEIIEAIKNRKIQYRENNMHGNPYLRLIRSEVEAIVEEKYGRNFLKEKKVTKELAQINKELKKLKSQQITLEKRKDDLLDTQCGYKRNTAQHID